MQSDVDTYILFGKFSLFNYLASDEKRRSKTGDNRPWPRIHRPKRYLETVLIKIGYLMFDNAPQVAMEREKELGRKRCFLCVM
jgi:hypothetical protein